MAGLFTVFTTSLVMGDMSWKQFLLLLAAGVAKDGGLFLKQFPIESLPPEKALNGTTAMLQASFKDARPTTDNPDPK